MTTDPAPTERPPRQPRQPSAPPLMPRAEFEFLQAMFALGAPNSSIHALADRLSELPGTPTLRSSVHLVKERMLAKGWIEPVRDELVPSAEVAAALQAAGTPLAQRYWVTALGWSYYLYSRERLEAALKMWTPPRQG